MLFFYSFSYLNSGRVSSLPTLNTPLFPFASLFPAPICIPTMLSYPSLPLRMMGAPPCPSKVDTEWINSPCSYLTYSILLPSRQSPH
jgi:hypothetical protein